MRNLILILTLLLFAIPAEAQTVADTLSVTIEGDLAGVEFATFSVSLRIGDTVQYVGQAYDSEGDPVTNGVVYTYATNQPTLLQIDAASGVAVALGKATPADNLLVIVRAEYGGLALRVASFQGGELNWGSTLPPAVVGEPYHAQLCSYLVDSDGFLVSQSLAPPVCPLVFAQRPTPPAFPMFAGISRVRPDLFLFGAPGQDSEVMR